MSESFDSRKIQVPKIKYLSSMSAHLLGLILGFPGNET